MSRAFRPTIDSGMALTGRPGVTDKNEGTGAPGRTEFNVVLPLVASGAEQTLTTTMPAKGIITDAYLNIQAASTAGVAQTISVGIAGSSTALLNAQATTATGIFASSKDVQTAGEAIVYTLGGADIVGLDAELLLQVVDFAE